MNDVFGVLALLVMLYGYLILARALISWIPNLDPYNPIIQILYQITEPVLEPVRRLIPPLGGTIDISIIVVFFALMILQRMLQGMAA